MGKKIWVWRGSDNENVFSFKLWQQIFGSNPFLVSAACQKILLEEFLLRFVFIQQANISLFFKKKIFFSQLSSVWTHGREKKKNKLHLRLQPWNVLTFGSGCFRLTFQHKPDIKRWFKLKMKFCRGFFGPFSMRNYFPSDLALNSPNPCYRRWWSTSCPLRWCWDGQEGGFFSQLFLISCKSPRIPPPKTQQNPQISHIG